MTIKYIVLCACLVFISCSDFYKDDFVHIYSAHKDSENKKEKEKKIQAMRKSQILNNSQSELVAIVYRLKDIRNDNLFANEEFVVEIFDTKHTKNLAQQLKARIFNAYTSIDCDEFREAEQLDLLFQTDISYNKAYLLTCKNLHGNDLKLEIKLKDSAMVFDYSLVKSPSKLSK